MKIFSSLKFLLVVLVVFFLFQVKVFFEKNVPAYFEKNLPVRIGSAQWNLFDLVYLRNVSLDLVDGPEITFEKVTYQIDFRGYIDPEYHAFRFTFHGGQVDVSELKNISYFQEKSTLLIEPFKLELILEGEEIRLKEFTVESKEAFLIEGRGSCDLSEVDLSCRILLHSVLSESLADLLLLSKFGFSDLSVDSISLTLSGATEEAHFLMKGKNLEFKLNMNLKPYIKRIVG